MLWDLEHYRLVAQLDGFAGRVYSARFVGRNLEVLTGGTDGAPRLWDGMTGQLRQTYRGNSRFLADATLTPDGSMIVGGDGDGSLRFWDAATARPLWLLRTHKSHLVGLHFEGEDIVTRGSAGDVARWTLPNPERTLWACEHGAACDIVSR